MTRLLKDAIERVAWTAAQAGVATAIVVLPGAGLPTWLIPLIGTALAAVKAFVARNFGNPDSASTTASI